MTMMMMRLMIGDESSAQRRFRMRHLSERLLLFLPLFLRFLLSGRRPQAPHSTHTRPWTAERDRRRKRCRPCLSDRLFLARSGRRRGQYMLKVAIHHRRRVEIHTISRLGAPWCIVIVRDAAFSCSPESRHWNPFPPPQILDVAT